MGLEFRVCRCSMRRVELAKFLVYVHPLDQDYGSFNVFPAQIKPMQRPLMLMAGVLGFLYAVQAG